MSTLKTNNIQHVDRSDPSIIINTDGSVNIAGTMTYEDVTNVDAVGIITGRNNIDAQKQVLVGTGVSVKAGGINVTAGISTFGGDVSVADKIIHTGDTNTAIRFPSADTITAETGGSERVRIKSNGYMGIGTNNPAYFVSIENAAPYIRIKDTAAPTDEKTWDFNAGTDGILRFRNTNDAASSSNNWLEVERDGVDTSSIRLLTGTGSERLRIDSSGRLMLGTTTEGLGTYGEDLTIASSDHAGITIRTGTGNKGTVYFSDATSGDGEYKGSIQYDHSDDSLRLAANANVRLFITSGGSALFNGLTSQTADTSKLAVQGGDSNIGIIQVHAGGGESDGDLSGISFSHGVDNATSRAKGAIAFRCNASGYGRGDLCFYVDGDSDNNQVAASHERLRITSAGLVGIGTDAPANDLHIMDGSATMKLTSTASSNSTRLILESEADTYGGVHFGDPSDEDAGRIRYYHGGSYPNSMRFSTDATDRMMIHSGGVVSFNNGIELGSGLDATAANTLDDYEEGTFGVGVTDSNNTFSTGQESGRYIKIGHVVHCTFTINCTISGTSGYAFFVTGFPFTVKNYGSHANEGLGTCKGTGQEIQLEAQQDQTTVKARNPTSGSAMSVNDIGCTNNTVKSIRGYIIYHTT